MLTSQLEAGHSLSSNLSTRVYTPHPSISVSMMYPYPGARVSKTRRHMTSANNGHAKMTDSPGIQRET